MVIAPKYTKFQLNELAHDFSSISEHLLMLQVIDGRTKRRSPTKLAICFLDNLFSLIQFLADKVSRLEFKQPK